MHWILQDNLFNEAAYQHLLETLQRFNIPHSIHKVIPFIGEITPEPVIETSNVICMGSYSLRHSAKKYGWSPGVFDLEPFPFPMQLEKWGNHMLNADAVVMPFRDVVIGEKRKFLRPIEDSKIFAGRVFDHYEFADWQSKVVLMEDDLPPGAIVDGIRVTNLSKDSLVQVSPVHEIYAEFRFWIVKGEIVTASMYKMGDKVMYDSDVPDIYHEFVDEMTTIWEPHDAFVIDVCSVPDDGTIWKGIKIVEINTLNSSGFYAGDMQKLVMALEDAFNDT